MIGASGALAGARMFRWDAQQRFARMPGKGWLAVALAESAIGNREHPFGVSVDLAAWSTVPLRALLFGEAQGRAVVSTDQAEAVLTVAKAHGVPAPERTPVLFPKPAALLTQAPTIEVLDGHTSGEAEFVLDFEGRAGGWVRITVFEDLKAGDGDRYFARASFREHPELQAVATASSPEDAAALCLREAGISLRRSS